MAEELPELVVPNVAGWRRWLRANHERAAGIWLVVAKKGTVTPTNLTYSEALEEAVCHGWIDGRIGRRDEATYRIRFTPRCPRSAWSQNNVVLATRLVTEGRIQPSGLREMERAKADGRWEAAYAGSAAITVPDDLAVALRNEQRAQERFERLSRQNRYAILYRLGRIKSPDARARKIEEVVAMLARGETIHAEGATRGPKQS